MYEKLEPFKRPVVEAYPQFPQKSITSSYDKSTKRGVNLRKLRKLTPRLHVLVQIFGRNY